MQLVQSITNFAGEIGWIAFQRLGRKHLFTLLPRQRLELNLEGEAAQCGLVNAIKQIRGADEHALEAFHALQHFIDFGDLVASLRKRSVLQKAIGFIQQQHGLFLLRFLEHSGHLLLSLTHIFAHQIAGFFDDQRAFNRLRDVFAERGFAGARHAEETERSSALVFKRRNDFFNRMSRLNVQQRQIVGGHQRPILRFVVFFLVPERLVATLQLLEHQCFDAVFNLSVRQLCKASGCVDLRGCQRFASRQLLNEIFAHIQACKVFSCNVRSHVLRRVFKLQMKLEAAAIGRVNLVDRV